MYVKGQVHLVALVQVCQIECNFFSIETAGSFEVIFLC